MQQKAARQLSMARRNRLSHWAKADSGYHFVNWTCGTEVVSTEPIYNTIAMEACMITANFEKIQSTGIENITETTKEGYIYDLSGRKTRKITKPGIYIINGRSVIAK